MQSNIATTIPTKTLPVISALLRELNIARNKPTLCKITAPNPPKNNAAAPPAIGSMPLNLDVLTSPSSFLPKKNSHISTASALKVTGSFSSYSTSFFSVNFFQKYSPNSPQSISNVSVSVLDALISNSG